MMNILISDWNAGHPGILLVESVSDDFGLGQSVNISLCLSRVSMELSSMAKVGATVSPGTFLLIPVRLAQWWRVRLASER